MRSLFKKLKKFTHPKRIRISELETFREFGEKSTAWWGTFQVESGQSRFWRVGNVVVFVDRFTNEWHIASSEVADVTQKSDKELVAGEQVQVTSNELSFKTFTFRTQAEISLSPVLADRSLASKLERPLFIPGGEEILVYISSPVWIRVTTGSTKIILDEIPTFHLSDTWFSNNTQHGELCYAGHTYCSTSLKEIPFGPDRIISPMLIKNKSKSLLHLEKVSVPLPFLSVYADEKNYLWTEQLNVKRERDENPEVLISKGPPTTLEQIIKLSSPRFDIHNRSSLKWLFGSILGE
jgi:hypothetical protein